MVIRLMVETLLAGAVFAASYFIFHVEAPIAILFAAFPYVVMEWQYWFNA